MTSYTKSLLHSINLFKDSNNDHSKVSLAVTSIRSWNDDIEKSFQKKNVDFAVDTKIPNNDDEQNKRKVTIEEVSIGLHEIVIRNMIEYFKLLCEVTSGDDNNSNESDSIIINSITKAIDTKEEMNDNKKANDLAMKLANQIQISYNKNSNNISTTMDSYKNKSKKWDILFESISEIFKACKHVLKLNRAILKANKIATRRKNHNSNGSGSFSGSDASICGIDSCHQLCTIGMIKLYLVLLEYNSHPILIPSTEAVTPTSSLSKTLFLRDQLARQACIILFHSTNSGTGNSDIGGEPISKKGLNALITSSSDVYAIPVLVKLLISSTSTRMMLVLMKFLHSLVGTISGIMISIDKEVKAIIQKQNKLESQEEGKEEQREEDKLQASIVSILISTLAWSVRSQPPIQSTTTITCDNDVRPDIAIEIIRILFAIQNRHRTYYKQISDNDTETMTQLGILIIDILHLPNKHPKMYECKTSTLILLMDAPREYTHFLYLNEIVQPLLQLLWIQLNQIVIEDEGLVQGQSSAATILPILIVLNKLCQSHDEMKHCIKNDIFPPTSLSNQNDEDENGTGSSDGDGSGIDGRSNAEMKSQDPTSSATESNNISPINAPPGTTRWKLIKLMTWTESNVKRCASELLWTLCDGNSKEFVKRTGFGNAVHMLGIRGLVNIPKSNN